MTERMPADVALLDSQQALQRIVDVSPIVISIYDLQQKRNVFVTRGMTVTLGYDPEQDAQQPGFIRSVMHPVDWQPHLDHLSRLKGLDDVATAEFEFRMRHANGEWRWLHSRDRVFTRNPDGSVRQIIGIATDVTARRNAEERNKFMSDLNQAFLPLSDPEKIMSVAVRMLGEYLGVDRCGYGEVDADNDHFVILGEYVRDATPRIAGRYRMSDFGGNERRILLENRPYVVSDIEAEAPPGTNLSLYRCANIRSMVCVPLNKGGNFVARMAIQQATPRHWSGEEIALVTTVADRCWGAIQRVKTVRSLKESEERYRAFIGNSSEAIWRFELAQPIPATLSEDDQIEMLYKVAYLAECNDAMARMYGYDSADQILGVRLGDLLVKSDPQNLAFLRALKRLAFRLTDVETREVDRNGNLKYFLNNLTLIRENGAIVRCWGTQRDITPQKNAAQALLESEKRLRRITDATQDALWEIDLQTRQLWWSEGAKPLFGHSPGELEIGLEDWYRGIHPEDEPRVRAKFESFMQGGGSEWSDEYRFRRADGSYVDISDQGRKFYDLKGKPTRIAGAMVDITERKRAEAALRESEERFAKAFDATPDFLVISRLADGVILEVNDSFAAATGYRRDEIIGKSTLQLGIYDDPEDRKRALAILARQNRVRDFEFAMKRKSGEVRLVSFSAEPLNIHGVRCWLTIGRDITQRKQAEKERERFLQQEKAAREDAEFANRMKDEFLATISHELRTPLTSIIGWAHMLTNSRLSEPQIHRALQVIDKSAKSQVRLVDDILDTSRIITGRFKLDAQPVEIDRVFQAAVDVIRPSAEAKGIELQSSIDDRGSLVLGDATRLQQVIWNLLSNAVKFTNENGRIETRLARTGAQIEISVSDTGLGIEPEFLPYIFDRFRQADSTSTRRYGGLGLGLAIVRHIVEMHGGTASASSPGKGMGSVFTVRFPVASPARLSHLSRPESESKQPLEQPRVKEQQQNLAGLLILVVEDDRDTLEMLSFILERCGAEVITAASAGEALKALESSRPNALVSDLAMPDQDGYELIAQVRSRPPEQGGNIPALALSAYARKEDRVRAAAAGFQMHVSKPVDPEELVNLVAKLVGRSPS